MRQFSEFGKQQRIWDRTMKKCIPVGYTTNPDAPKPKNNKKQKTNNQPKPKKVEKPVEQPQQTEQPKVEEKK